MLKSVFPNTFKSFKQKSLLSLSVLLIFINIFFLNPQGTIMSDPVLKTAINIVDKGTLEIHPHSGIDISVFKDKFYSGLPLGASLLAIPTYFIFQKLIEKIPEKFYVRDKVPGISPRLPFEYDKRVYFLQILTVITVIIPMFLIFYLSFVEYLLFIGKNKLQTIILSLIFSLGSFHFVYQSVYSRQFIACFFLWTGFLLFERHKHSLNKLKSFILGIFLFFSLWVDYFSFLIMVPLYLFWFVRNKDKRFILILMGLGGLTWVIFIVSHHYYLFDSFLKTPYHFRIGFHPDYVYPVNYGDRVFYSNDQTLLEDILYFNGINFHALWGLIFSRFKGILWFLPSLLLWPILISQWENLNKYVKSFAIGMIIIFAVNLLYLLGLQEEYFWSGVPSFWGPRYLMLSSFFVFLPLVYTSFEKKMVRVCLAGVFVFGLFINFLGASFSYLMKDRILLGLNSERVYQMTQDPIWECFKYMLNDGWSNPIYHFYPGGVGIKFSLLLIFLLFIFTICFLFIKDENLRLNDL